MSLLEVRNLSIGFQTATGPLQVVDSISFSVEAGETFGLVGESGCGKSVTAQSLLGLLPARKTRVSGSIGLSDRELVGLAPDRWRDLRGRKVSMVFQDPMTSLNPLLTIGAHLEEVLRLHRNLSGSSLREEAAAWLARVGISDPASRMRAYPFEFSGGMRQRVLIALALAGRPELLVADEPTTALDVTIQAQILELLRSLQEEFKMGMIFITHDLGVIERISDKLAVMYAGRLVETGPTQDVMGSPRHPYTKGLMESVPGFHARRSRLVSIGGTVPSPNAWPSGCRFHPRCPRASDACRLGSPALATDGEHAWACFHPLETTP
jgi:oligopeptide/dipeptide ABC transporter ATP-binding protein